MPGWAHVLPMRSPESTPSDPDELIRFGRVASVDLAAARCTVTIDEDGATGEAVTGPIRWIEARAGQTRTWSPPSEGEEVVLLCPAGNIGAAIALRGLANTDFPAAGDSLTELMRFSDGAVLSYDPQAHALSFDLPGGATLSIQASGGVSIEGDVIVSGTVTATTDVVGGGKSLKGHRHSGVQSGGSQTGTPV